MKNLIPKIVAFTGSTLCLLLSVLLMLIWCVYGYIDHYSDHSQMILSTITSIITFIMVFMIQGDSNKNSKATHIKLDELIRALETGNDARINIECLTDKELDQIKNEYKG